MREKIYWTLFLFFSILCVLHNEGTSDELFYFPCNLCKELSIAYSLYPTKRKIKADSKIKDYITKITKYYNILQLRILLLRKKNSEMYDQFMEQNLTRNSWIIRFVQ